MYLPQELINRHEGKVIGVLGSGPTLNDYKNEVNNLCDIIIAVNGSVNSLDPRRHYVDYFLWYDGISFIKDWFSKSENFYQTPKIKLPILDMISRKKTIRLSPGILEHESSLADEIYYYEPKVVNYNSSFGIDKHLIYNWCTVSGLAIQFAYHMGAKQINLFGCSFDNDSGQNYSYVPQKSDIGSVSNHQRIGMDNMIRKIKKKGIEVVCYGDTRLKEPRVILENVNSGNYCSNEYGYREVKKNSSF